MTVLLGRLPAAGARPRRAHSVARSCRDRAVGRRCPRCRALPTHDPALEAALRRGLADVEALLAAGRRRRAPAFGDASGHLMAAGGKRFRPLLTLLASQLGHRRRAGRRRGPRPSSS